MTAIFLCLLRASLLINKTIAFLKAGTALVGTNALTSLSTQNEQVNKLTQGTTHKQKQPASARTLNLSDRASFD